jgi:hypothetical protein
MFDSCVWRESTDAFKVGAVVSERREERDDSVIEVIQDLDLHRCLCEQDGGRPGEGLDVGRMWREQGSYPCCTAGLTAMEVERRAQRPC